MQYSEDYLRLIGYCICDCSKYSQTITENLKKVLLLESSRSIAASIINGLKSSLEEYSFLQYYQCLEYLFRLNNSFDLQDTFHIGPTESIEIVTKYEFKIGESDNLRKIIANNIVEDDIDKYIDITQITIKPDASKEEKYTAVAKKIYTTRCHIAHLRYGQNTELTMLNWMNEIHGIVKLILAIYQKYDSKIVSTCSSNKAWSVNNFAQSD